MPYDFGGEWTLRVEDGQGRELTGRTTLLDTVAMKPIEFNAGVDGRKSATVRWDDFPEGDNYYQLYIQIGSRDPGPYLSFTLDDRIGNGDEFVISTLPELPIGSDGHFVILHFEEAAWLYLETIDDAEDSNGNPFAQPGSIKSTVEGGLGIFSTLATTYRNVTIP